MRAAATFHFPQGPSISALVRSFVHKHRLKACCEPGSVLSLWYLAPALREGPVRQADTHWIQLHACPTDAALDPD